jgi:MFS family permease
MIIYFVFIKNSPKSPANQFTGQKAFNYEGFMKVFSNSKFNILLILIFVGLGAFNAITSEVDDIFIRFTEPEASGIIGGMMIIGGILGAGILSTISDMTKKRVIFLKLAMIIATPSTILLVVVNDFNLIILSAFIFGFFLVSALPVSLIYASEITYPVSEETSNGIMMTLGQISGLLLLIEFNMYVISFLFLVSTLLSFFLKDYIPEKAPNVS